MKKNENIINKNFQTFEEMEKSARNWGFKNIYKLLPHADVGSNHVVMLPDMQLTYTENDGGVLFDVKPPKGMITVAVVEKNEGKACYGDTKLKEGTVVFCDDRKSHPLITSGPFKVAVFSFSKKAYKELGKKLTEHAYEVIEDTDNRLQHILEEALQKFLSDPAAITDTNYKEKLQEELIAQLEAHLKTQTPKHPKLTKGERIALEIRDRVYRKMNPKISISALADEFNVSEQTLQNAFKSLFGFTPNIFIRHMKLNHVCKALQKADPSTDTIVRISKKWGFTHMGHFSRYFTQLFGENPSVTLSRECSIPQK